MNTNTKENKSSKAMQTQLKGVDVLFYKREGNTNSVLVGKCVADETTYGTVCLSAATSIKSKVTLVEMINARYGTTITCEDIVVCKDDIQVSGDNKISEVHGAVVVQESEGTMIDRDKATGLTSFHWKPFNQVYGAKISAGLESCMNGLYGYLYCTK